MADTYVTLSSLKHYDEKIKGVIDEKQDKLVGTDGQVVSFDADGNVISKTLEVIDTSEFAKTEELDNKLDKENPTGTGSLSLNRKTDSTIGDYSVAVGKDTEASGIASFAEGKDTNASGDYSHVEGLGNNKLEAHEEETVASCSNYLQLTSTGFGNLGSYNPSSNITSNGDYVYNGKSYKYYTLINDISTIFSNWSTLPQSNYYEGYIDASPSSDYSGYGLSWVYSDFVLTNENTSSSTSFYLFTNSTDINSSLAEPIYSPITIKIFSYQTTKEVTPKLTATHIQGKYSLVDKEYAHIVGGGTSDSNRKNIHTLDWDGNAEFSGDVTTTKEDGNKVSLNDVANKTAEIEKDYLKSSDKEELTSAIATAKQETINTILGEKVDVDFDTLTEVAEWIQSDTTNSAELVTRVSNAEKDIEALENITIPTKTSELTNDSNFLTAHPTISKDTDTTSTASPTHGGTFTAVDSITRDGNGHVTKVNTKTITLPADNNTTYTNQSLGNGYGTCTTSASTVAKVVTLSSYNLVTNGRVSVKFTYAVPASATLNINSKGAKPIYHRGTAIKDGVINAGDVATFVYNGSQYILISVDNVVDVNTLLTKSNPSGTGTFNMNGTVNGSYSSVLGHNNTAFGNYSHVEGLNNNKLDTFKDMTVVSCSGTASDVNTCSDVYDGVSYIKYANITLNTVPSIPNVSSTGYYKGKIVNSAETLTVSDVLIYYSTSYAVKAYSTEYSLMNFAGASLTLYFEQTEIPPSTEATHIQGKYALVDKTYAHVVGNGTSDTARSNAHTLDWDGNAVYSGDVCATDSNGNLVSLLDVASNSGETEKPFYIGTCSTSASTAAKTVSITGFELKKGVEIHVKFSNTNTSSSSTLNVSSTGAIAMYYKDGTRMYYIPSGIYHTFEYDGTYWRYLGSENAILSGRTYERYGLKMSGSTLVPIDSSYIPTLGNYSYPLNIYANTATVNSLNVKTGSSGTTKVLPPLPLLYGHFVISSYHSVSFDASVYNQYAKILRAGYVNSHCDGTSSGCASGTSNNGNNYDALFLFRVIGYDTSSSMQVKPFVQDVLLSTANMTGSCADYSSEWCTFTTPCGNSVTLYLTGISVDSCGYISGTPALNIMSSSMVHFSEISLMA